MALENWQKPIGPFAWLVLVDSESRRIRFDKQYNTVLPVP